MNSPETPDRCDACGTVLTDANRLDVYGDGDTLVCSEFCADARKEYDESRAVDNQIEERR